VQSPGHSAPYDAYSPADQLHDQSPSSHPAPPHHHHHHHQQPAAGAPCAVRQPWYEMYDGVVTPPDDSSSSSCHRAGAEFISHALPPPPHAAGRRHRSRIRRQSSAGRPAGWPGVLLMRPSIRQDSGRIRWTEKDRRRRRGDGEADVRQSCGR